MEVTDMNQTFKVSMGIIGAVCIILGSIQGLGLGGVGEEPIVQGILGGLFPVLAGWSGGYAFSVAFRGDTPT